MGILRYAVAGSFKKFYLNLNKISKENNISKFKLIYKFLYSFSKIKCGYSDFLNYKLYSRSKSEILNYVTINDQDKFYEIVSPSKYKKDFSIKPRFLKKFKNYIYRDYFTVEMGFSNLKKFLKLKKEVIIKPIDGLGGHGVKKIKVKDIENLKNFYEKLKKERLFLEEVIVQHKDIAKLSESSVNSLRIVTYSNFGKTEIVFAAIRIGNGKSSVDNFHQGGMGVLIDIEKGILKGNAFDKELNEYVKHPITNIKFDKYKIPNWELVKETVLSASLISKNIHVVGWDVAVMQDKVTFIEGNRRPGWDLQQVLENRGRKDIMNRILRDF